MTNLEQYKIVTVSSSQEEPASLKTDT